MLIPNKYSGYQKDGVRKYYFDGGGGSSAPEKTTQVSDLPDWAKPYAQDTLARASALTQGSSYQPYSGERTAQFTPLQQQSFYGAQTMQPAYQTSLASGMTAQAAGQAMNAGQNYDPYQASMLTAQAPGLANYQMGPAQQVFSQNFTQPGTASQYMSPYIQQALEPQLREATRASESMRNQNQAQAVAQGAYGGSRQAIVEAERQRNLGTQLGDIEARGLQTAYEQAANQFNQDAARRLQAQMANQQAGLTVGGQNLNAALGVQQLGAQTGMQAQLANQQAYQNAQQLAEQSRQYGSGLGLQGLQTALSGANQLGQLGQTDYMQRMGIYDMQNQYGTQQQQQVQNILSQQYQDFLNQQLYPYQQLEYMSNILRGTPTGTTSTLYQQEPSLANQLVGAGTALYGASKMAKKGGVIKEPKPRSAGLAELALSKI